MPSPETPPPGQQRPYPSPTSRGRIPFSYPKNNMQGETSYSIYGSLSSSTVPLILLHGGPGMSHKYLLPTSLISQDYDIPVIMYDQIGCGESSHFPETRGNAEFWTPDLFMDELENLKSHLNIETFDLLGQSWGGMLAGQYAIERQPHGLRKLIIADSPSDMKVWVEVANRLREALPEDVRETLERCEREGTTDTKEYDAAVRVFYSRHVCRVVPFPAEMEACFKDLEADDTVYFTMNGPSEFHVIGSLKTWRITDQLEKITAETAPGGVLVMNGYYDEAQDETCAPYFMKPSARTKWIRYALSSHLPMLEETEAFLKDLGRFLVEE